MSEQYYSACQYCTAKWFSRKKLRKCPRCGSVKLWHTREIPPWTLWATHTRAPANQRDVDFCNSDANE